MTPRFLLMTRLPEPGLGEAGHEQETGGHGGASLSDRGEDAASSGVTRLTADGGCGPVRRPL